MHSSPLLSLEIRWVNPLQVVVDLRGELCMATVAGSRKRLLQLARKSPAVLVINLAGLQAMDTAGIAVLVEVFRTLRQLGGKLILAALDGKVRQMVQLTRLDQLLTVCDSVEEALRIDHIGSGQATGRP